MYDVIDIFFACLGYVDLEANVAPKVTANNTASLVLGKGEIVVIIMMITVMIVIMVMIVVIVMILQKETDGRYRRAPEKETWKKK